MIFREGIMELFDIAGLKVGMNCLDSGLLYERSRAYLSRNQNEAPDFSIDIPEEILAQKHKALPQLTLDECRYVYMGEAFYYKLLGFDGMLLHASCVAKDGKAYLFSAKSGTGKSTHTHLWMDTLEGVTMINDDKPALREIDGRFYACGTPFSGKNDESENILVPIRAIVFLERAGENSVERITPKEALPLFMSQTVRPSRKENMIKMLDILDRVLTNVPVYKLKCNISKDAVLTAYNGIEADLNEN